MRFSTLLTVAAWLSLGVGAVPSRARALQPRQSYKHNAQQDIVEWDSNSLVVKGERVLILSGEFHPFRLPVPDLWLDIFQKIRSLNFNAVSFYVDWALLEGKQGDYTAEGVFDFQPFFEAASKAGIYLIARPGPYINAEVSGGGFPGWLQRISGKLRTPAPDYLNATTNYINKISAAIAKAQITNGGPVILLQPENEYTVGSPGTKFPDAEYFQDVENQYRAAGITVPFISNDAGPAGYFTPGSGEGAVDIYGHDAYPLGFDCSNPTNWPNNNLPGNFHQLHMQQSPGTPYSLDEFQGGSFDPWGGVGLDQCAAFINEEFERVFYKQDYSFGVKILSLYMIYGGTNWGNLGHPGGYTSYDYGAVIAENRLITREKYSELKLQGTFLQSSPAYLTAAVLDATTGVYTDTSDVTITPLLDTKTGFWVIRHSAYNTLDSTSYTLKLPTSAGNLTIPQLNGTLSLNGRDSKIHVTDYDLAGVNLLYSSAEIFTWKAYGSKRVLVLYGGPRELHEAAIEIPSKATTEGEGVTVVQKNGTTILNWQTSSQRRVVSFGSDLVVYLLDRNSAYNYWVLDIPGAPGAKSSVIVKAGYLLRTASVDGTTLHLTGDINATTTVEVIGAPDGVDQVSFNGQSMPTRTGENKVLFGNITYEAPALGLPDLSALDWTYVDSLPELGADYDDSAWITARKNTTNLNGQSLSTPTSLFAGDYGFNTGYQVFRAHFVATGNESTFQVTTIGGTAYGASLWLNGAFLGSFAGDKNTDRTSSTVTLPTLKAGASAVITVLVDHMGLDEDYDVGGDDLKTPRGILDYQLAGHTNTDLTWKLTGNLGGEEYQDRARGPLNEGGLYAERQGWHLPSPPTASFKAGKPTDGISNAGVAFYTTSFDLNIPQGYDVPLSFDFTPTTTNGTNYRCQIYVNGYQFGKYVNNIGPQTSFPVPEGILNYHGKNYIALSLWALDASGAKVSVALKAGTALQGGLGPITLSPMPAWQKRVGAY